MKRQEITQILSAAGLQPRHRYGQNFMVDQNILAAIADAGQIQPEDIVMEVGPGVGNLTRLLAQRAAVVLAIDIDAKLLAAAQRHHREVGNIHWIQSDVLAGKHEIEPKVVEALQELRGDHRGGQLRLVSNLPYNAASPLVAELLVLMRHHLAGKSPLNFALLAFTVQWEVAQRLAASPGTADYGPLGILVQLMAGVEIVRKIPPGAFWPPPKVQSALVIVTPVPEKMMLVQDPVGLQQLLAGIFSHRRQTLQNALKHHLKTHFTAAVSAQITGAGIDLALRPEKLLPHQFLQLAQIVRQD